MNQNNNRKHNRGAILKVLFALVMIVASPVYGWAQGSMPPQGAGNFQWENYQGAVNAIVPGEYILRVREVTTNKVSEGSEFGVSLKEQPVASITTNMENNTVCAGTEVILTANAAEKYLWSTGETTRSITVPPTETTNYWVEITNGTCTSEKAEITLQVTPAPPVSVLLEASQTTICEGTEVIFTATPTNGGVNPSYRWFKNDVVVDNETQPTFATNQLDNGDVITVELTSDAVCATGSPAMSNTVTMEVNPKLEVSVVLAASQTTICEGTEVVFTATPTNGGTNPSYLWFRNGVKIDNETLATYSSNQLANGDVITVELTSDVACATGSPAMSNSVTMEVNPKLAVSVILAASQTTICEGTEVSFTATPTNGGTSPTYLWFRNGVKIDNETLATYSSNQLANGDVITVELTSDAVCATGNPATSNKITLAVSSTLAVTVNPTIDCGATQGTINISGLDPNKRYEYLLIPKNKKPVITLLGANPVTLTVGDTYTDAGATAQDAVFGDLTNQIVVESTVNTAVAGTYTVTYKVANPNGLSAIDVVRTVVVEAPATYMLTVNGGVGSGFYAPGTQVQIVAGSPVEGQRFKQWVGDVLYLNDEKASTAIVTMPAENVSVKATYELIPQSFTMTTTKQTNFSITLICSIYNTVTIDWGDGSSTLVNDGTAKTKSWATSGNHLVTVIGDLSKITNIICTSQNLIELNLSNALTRLIMLACNYNQLTNLTIPNELTAITNLYCYSNQLTSLTLPSGLTGMGQLRCEDNNLTNLILPTGLTKLASLYCPYNPNLTPPDISKIRTISSIYFTRCGFDQSEVDAIISNALTMSEFDNSVVLVIDNSNTGGAVNSAPSATGLANIATLRSRGWTVNYQP